MWKLLSVIVFSVKCEWVEIPQLTNTEQPPEYKQVTFPVKEYPSTTPDYKMFMETPTESGSILSSDSSEASNEDSVNKPTEAYYADSSNLTSDIDKTHIDGSGGFLPFLNNIQDTLTNNARRGSNGKVTLLKKLRDDLLSNIDDQMKRVNWRPIGVEERGYHDDHEMDFPSNESALMTIGFLTFAVFLIKLVLKLIYALKNKNNGNMMMMTTMAPPAAILYGRKRRDVDGDSIKILQMIEEYSFI